MKNYTSNIKCASLKSSVNSIENLNDVKEWDKINKYLSETVNAAMLRMQCYNDHIRQESLQIAALKAWSYRHIYDKERGKLTTWLNKIVARSIWDVVEAEQKNKDIFERWDDCHDDTLSDVSACENDVLDRNQIIERFLEYGHSKGKVYGIVAEMMLQDCDNTEIAKALGKNNGNVSVYKNRLINGFKKFIGANDEKAVPDEYALDSKCIALNAENGLSIGA